MPAHGLNGEFGAAAPGVAAEASSRGLGLLHKKPFMEVLSALENPRELLDVMLTPALQILLVIIAIVTYHVDVLKLLF